MRIKKRWRARIFATSIAAVLLHISRAHADATLETLVTFDGTNGFVPQAGVIEGRDGNLYGTLSYGGWYDLGTIYRLAPNGTCVILTTFDGANGSHPSGRLVQGKDGDFYGTTLQGGVRGDGTVFKLSPAGTATTLFSFGAYGENGGQSTNGWEPCGGLTEGKDGNSYGTTTGTGFSGNGTVFKITPNGKLTTLAAFNETNGSQPVSEVVEGTDGSFYGTTTQGGPKHNGTTFKLSADGILTAPASFHSDTTGLPFPLLIKEASGDIYGTDNRPAFRVNSNSVLSGVGWLLQAKDGNCYGTTFAGNADGTQFGFGTVFRISRDGLRTTLVSFNRTNGANPLPDLVQSREGIIYGVTTSGGIYNQGTVFRLQLTQSPSPQLAATPTINVPVLGDDQ